MAGSQSFAKRENEKKKQAKRIEKLKRKEERQAAAGSVAQIAWVDENGMLTDVPPEERAHKREEIALEDIEVSTPRRADIPVEPLKGRVDYFNQSKGYGFIREAESGEKYFFHISVAPVDIAEGRTVHFELERGTRGMNAVRITYA